MRENGKTAALHPELQASACAVKGVFMKNVKLRRINSWISLILIILLVFHLLTGAGIMVGLITGGFEILGLITYIMLALLIVHIVIGFILTIQTSKIKNTTKAGYDAENRAFWRRRDSGFLMIIFLILHLLFWISIGEFVLRPFRIFQLIVSILLVLSIVIHIGTNIKPLLISFGVRTQDRKVRVIAAIIAIVCLLAAAAFVYYFVRWNVFHDFSFWE